MSEALKKKRGRRPHTDEQIESAKEEVERRIHLAKSLFGEVSQQAGGLNQPQLEDLLGLNRSDVSDAIRGRRPLTVEAVGKILINYVFKLDVEPELKKAVLRIPLELSLEELMQSEAKLYELESELRRQNSVEKINELKLQRSAIESEIQRLETTELQAQVRATQEILDKLSALYLKKTGKVLGKKE